MSATESTKAPGFDRNDIAAAERVLGVRYSEAERALMQVGLAEQIALAHTRRGYRLDPDLAPATLFDPRLRPFTRRDPGKLVLAPNAPTALPAQDDAIAFAPITAQIGWIRAGLLTARRLTEIYRARIAAHNPRLNCYARLNDEALARADALDAMAAQGRWAGPLHGIPYGCKDIIDTAGLVTDWGAEPYRDRVPEQDAVVVQRLAEAGAILLGKTSVGALAYGDLWFGGRTRNPWNLDEGSSGSSAGSAAATAAGLCGFSLGTETYGSIVSPSTRCGTVGLRPSFGRIARTGTMALCPSLDKIGAICRSVDDTALILAVLNGADDGDPASLAISFGGDCAADCRGLRVGYIAADFAAEGARAEDRMMLEHCRTLGVTLVERTRDDLPYDSLVSILMAEAAASFEDLTSSDRDDLLTWQSVDAWPNQFRMARFLSAVDHVQLDRLRRRAMIAIDQVMRDIDVLIGPSFAGPMLAATNFTGHPCLCLPSCFIDVPSRIEDRLAGTMSEPTRSHRVPASISLWGRLFEESPILSLGRALAQLLSLDLQPPGF
ncbi:MAG TPA: amidase [Acidiphilium sp.]|nr:amidase [Acidiphilium sp.]HQU23277.1 amidase [Acidiphilium sp.]